MPTDYTITIDAVGDFVIHPRTFQRQLDIVRELNRLMGGQSLEDLSDWYMDFCGVIAEATVLLAQAPAGWALQDKVVNDFPAVQQLMRAVREQENSFRTAAAAA